MIPEKLSLILSAVPTSAPDAGTSITVMVVIGTLAGLLIIAVNIKKLFWDKARSAPAFATRNELKEVEQRVESRLDRFADTIEKDARENRRLHEKAEDTIKREFGQLQERLTAFVESYSMHQAADRERIAQGEKNNAEMMGMLRATLERIPTVEPPKPSPNDGKKPNTYS